MVRVRLFLDGSLNESSPVVVDGAVLIIYMREPEGDTRAGVVRY